MSQESMFFDSESGDRIYGSEDMASVVNGMVSTGIVSGVGTEYAVTEDSPPAMTVLVGLGNAYILGYFHRVYGAAEELTISTADATNPRIDRIVLRRDLTNRTVVLAVKAGTPAASPSAPALTQSESGTYEIPIARIAVAANATSIVTANITDERGTRATGAGLSGLLDADTGHRHEGTDATGRAVRHSHLSGLTSGNPHTQYQQTSQKNAQNGYAGLDDDANARVPSARLGTGTADANSFLRGDRIWSTAPPIHNHTAGQGGAVPYTSLTSLPTSFAPSAHSMGGAAHTGNAGDIGGVLARNTPDTAAGGKKIYTGTAQPTGAAEGDIWIVG